MLTSILPRVFQGALAPEALTIHVKQGESPLDLTTVTGATLSVRRPDGEEFTWTAALAAGPNPPVATSTDLWILYGFASGDVDYVGTYDVVPNLITPGGTIRAVPGSFEVVPKYGRKRSGA